MEKLCSKKLKNWLIKDIKDSSLFVKGASLSILDIGSGNGSDAVWLSDLGHEVTALESSKVMREEGQTLYQNKNIFWLDDKFPDLNCILREGLFFDCILINGVWMHLAREKRQRAFRKIINCLKPGGFIVITYREELKEDEADDKLTEKKASKEFTKNKVIKKLTAEKTPIYPVSLAEIEQLALEYRASVKLIDSKDRLEEWKGIIIRLADNVREVVLNHDSKEACSTDLINDSKRALSRLVEIILNDKKTTTYKLGLLKSLTYLVDKSPGLVKKSSGYKESSQLIEVPLGAMALNWLKFYKPLIELGFPQIEDNRALGFIKEAYKKMKISEVDLRIGQEISKRQAPLLHEALKDVIQTITSDGGPIKRIKDANKNPIFIAHKYKTKNPETSLYLDSDYLFSFGTLEVPQDIWLAMRRYSVWIESVLMSEWSFLISQYASQQGKVCYLEKIREVMSWSWGDCTRDVSSHLGFLRNTYEVMSWKEYEHDISLAKEQAQKLMSSNKLFCVWSGKKMTKNYDIDYVFPWSTWECTNLWNFLPSSYDINQNPKKTQIPSFSTLEKVKDRLCSWWDEAYLKNKTLQKRFEIEAQSSFSIFNSSIKSGANPKPISTESLFQSICLQQIRLKQNQKNFG